MTMKKTFLICPVRGVSPSVTEKLVADLEAEGWTVHWPHRDTDQNDSSGLRICHDNRKAIKSADVVHVVWDGNSQGCLFDLGMAFAMDKRVIPVTLPAFTDHKSFQNMIRDWSGADGF